MKPFALRRAVGSPIVTHFRGFNRNSPTLVGPLPSIGFCLGTEDLHADTLHWLAFAAPIFSGDPVTLFVETGEFGFVAGGKILERTRDGRWWTLCWYTREISSLIAVPLDHPKLHVLAIAATVATARIPRARPRDPYPDEWMTPERKDTLDRIGKPAVDEWRRHGFPPPRELPFTQYPETIEYIRERLAA